MKKKWLKIVSVLLSVISLLTFIGCGDKEEENKVDDQEVVEDTTEITNYQTPVFYQATSFESMDELFQIYLPPFSTSLGKISFNDDKNFVTDGDYSARVEVWGSFTGATRATMMIPFAKEGYGDLSLIKAVTFDVYNQTGEEKQIWVSLQMDGAVTESKEVTLSTGKNSVQVPFDAIGLSLGYDVSKGEYIKIEFESATSPEDAKTNVYYLDNVGFSKSLMQADALQIQIGEGEICSFDHYYQKYILSTRGIGPVASCQPVLTINSDLKYCVGSTGKSMKAVLPTGTAPINDGWPEITLISSFWQLFDWTSYAEQDMTFAVDVYNTGAEFNISVYVHALDSSISKGYATNLKLKKGWNKVELKIAEWNSPLTEEQPVLLTDNIECITFLYSKFTGPARTFYFDNMRVY